MAIQQGSITESVVHFVPEVIGEGGGTMDSRFELFSESLLRHGEPPNSGETYSFGDIGGFQGPWEFWNDLRPQETDHNFHFRPRFSTLSIALELSPSFQERFSVSDYKISPRVVYYPFGLFVVRLRIYFKLSSPASVPEFIAFQNALFDNIDVWSRSPSADSYLEWHSDSDNIVKSILGQVLESIFDGSVPDDHWGRAGDLHSYPITYLYGEHDLSADELFKITHQDTRDYRETHIQSLVNSKVGQFEGDEILVDGEGSTIHTPYFETISPKNRRWKRIRVLNNIYLATEIARFEQNNTGRLTSELDRDLDEFVEGTLYGVPLSPDFLVILRELLLFGNRLKDLRGDVYDELRPESKDRLYNQVTGYIDRDTQHESDLRQAVKSFFPDFI